MESVVTNQEALLRDLVNAIADRIKRREAVSFLQATQRRFGFDSAKGWTLLCHCMDLLGDCELAITSYKQHKLGGPGYGEQLLRLSGLLNCTYQQGWAIVQLCELFKVIGIKAIESEFRSLHIIQLRNISAAHTVTFKEGSTGNHTSFTISSPHLGVGLLWVFDEENNKHEWDLPAALAEYVNWAERTMHAVCTKSIESLFRTSPTQLAEFKQKLRIVKGGHG
jgi:hypothetical protein